MPARPGDTIARYIVESVLGAGAMANIYSVVHETLETKHALKVLQGGSPDIQERLVREGKVQASLRHPNVVAVTDVFEHEGKPVLLMELVEGPDLDLLLQDHSPTLDEALAIFGGILAGLRSAHERGIIHRDLKPGNVLLGIDPREVTPKVADFGLAKALDGSGDGKKTKAGATMGTPAYMAPEQIKDASTADHRADIFSLGCILYELVTGKQCFEGENIFGIFSRIATLDLVPVRELEPDVPQQVVDAIDGALKLDRDERFQSCDELAEVLFGGTTGFPTAVPVDGLCGRATTALWDRQQAAAREHADSVRSLPTMAPEDDDAPPEHVEVSHTLAEAPSGPGRGFYVGLAAVTLLLMVGIIGGAGAIVMSLSEEEDAPPAADVQEALEAVPAPEDDAPVAPVEEELVEEPAAPEPTEAPVVEEAPPPVEAPAAVHATAAVDPEPVEEPAAPAEEEPAEAAAPAPAGGTFKLAGDARTAVLVDPGGRRYAPGDPIPPGTYEIHADFGGGETAAGEATILGGRTAELKCVSMMARCTAR